MFFPEARVRVYLYGQAADMRESFDALYGIARAACRDDRTAGSPTRTSRNQTGVVGSRSDHGERRRRHSGSADDAVRGELGGRAVLLRPHPDHGHAAGGLLRRRGRPASCARVRGSRIFDSPQFALPLRERIPLATGWRDSCRAGFAPDSQTAASSVRADRPDSSQEASAKPGAIHPQRRRGRRGSASCHRRGESQVRAFRLAFRRRPAPAAIRRENAHWPRRRGRCAGSVRCRTGATDWTSRRRLRVGKSGRERGALPDPGRAVVSRYPHRVNSSAPSIPARAFNRPSASCRIRRMDTSRRCPEISGTSPSVGSIRRRNSCQLRLAARLC